MKKIFVISFGILLLTSSLFAIQQGQGQDDIQATNLIPNIDNNYSIGYSTRTYKDIAITDENGTKTSLRGALALLRRITSGTSILVSSTSYVVSSGTMTVTLTSANPVSAFNIGEKILTVNSSTMSVNIQSFAGTNTNPKDVYIYIRDIAGVATMEASNIDPDGIYKYVNIAKIKLGGVWTSSATVYGIFYNDSYPSEFVYHVLERFQDDGTLYRTGLPIEAFSNTISIGTGTVKRIFETLTTSSMTTSIAGFYNLRSDGTYQQRTAFDFAQYGTGETITTNRYYSVVFGVMADSADNKIFAIIQDKPATEYNSVDNAQADISGVTVYTPRNQFLQQLFVPVCRVIMQKGASLSTILQPTNWANLYYDLRGRRFY